MEECRDCTLVQLAMRGKGVRLQLGNYDSSPIPGASSPAAEILRAGLFFFMVCDCLAFQPGVHGDLCFEQLGHRAAGLSLVCEFQELRVISARYFCGDIKVTARDFETF